MTSTIEILGKSVWIESDALGSRHVMAQHEGGQPFRFCSFFYDYRHTDNSGTWRCAESIALALGATKPVENRQVKVSYECDHKHYTFKKHGRHCTCGALMVDFGD